MNKLELAIVKKPPKSFINGITSTSLGIPDYEKAIIQHYMYVDALKEAGLSIIELPADEHYPDSCFVEDCAVVADDNAVIGNFTVEQRKGEEKAVNIMLEKYYTFINHIEDPGTLEGGDVLRVNDHFFVGITNRTNSEGAQQFTKFMKKFGYNVETIKLENVLHLKSAINYLADDLLLATEELSNLSAFSDFEIISVPMDESYAANSLRVNDYVIVPEGYPKTKRLIEDQGLKTLQVDISEFKKLEGGLTCLSIRF